MQCHGMVQHGGFALKARTLTIALAIGMLATTAGIPPAQSSITINAGDVAAAVTSAAATLYGTGGVVSPASNGYFAAAFPHHELYAVTKGTGIPPEVHAMAWNPTLQRGFDATKDFNALLADAGAIIANSADALKYSKAYAEIANVELQVKRDVVFASDSTRLGETIADPAATQLLDGWQVTLTTWADENGVLANWIVRYTTTTVANAKWKVAGVGVGPEIIDLTALNLASNHWIWNVYSPTTGHALSAYREEANGDMTALKLPSAAALQGWSVFTTGTNFDGSTWTVYYPSQSIATIPANAAHVGNASRDGGVAAYNKQVTRNVAGCAGTTNPSANWGFTSKDTNCNLEVYVLDWLSLYCQACITGGDDARIYIAPTVIEFVQALGYYTNAEKHTVDTILSSIMAHEHFHNLQYAIMKWKFYEVGWTDWLGLIEGTARFSQVLSDPAVEQDPSSLWYAGWPNGVNAYAEDATTQLCQQEYGAGLYWGWYYDTKGGIGAIKTVLEKMNDVTEQSCPGGMSYAINMALGGANNQFDRAKQTYHDFSQNYFYPRDYTWAGPTGGASNNWAQHLNAPSDGGNSISTGGFSHKHLPSTGIYDVTCSWLDEARLYLRSGSSVTVTNVACGGAAVRVNMGSYNEAVFVAVRTVPDEAYQTFSVTFTRV